MSVLTRHTAVLGRMAAKVTPKPLAPMMGQARSISHERDAKCLGKYPVPLDEIIWWKNRFQVPGGQVEQSWSSTQQKIVWPYFHSNPGKWWHRINIMAYLVFCPAIIVYLVFYKSCEADVEENIRMKTWY